MVEILLKSGATIDKRDRNDVTALVYGIWNGNFVNLE